MRGLMVGALAAVVLIAFGLGAMMAMGTSGVNIEIVQSKDESALVTPCVPGQELRSSDLCAQWKAADAARDSAFWAKLSFFVGAIGSLLLLRTLYDGAKASSAAIEAVQIQMAAERPLLNVNELKIKEARILDDRFYVTIEWTVKNYGRTAAWLEASCFTIEDAFENAMASDQHTLNALINPGGWITAGQEAHFDHEETTRVLSQKMFLLWGYTIYRDAGGRRWKTGFANRMSLNDNLSLESFGPVPSDEHWSDVRL